METLERKDTDAVPVPEEPIKSEGMVPSPSTSDRSNSAGSPPPNCSICLGKLINTSFTDSCLHQFCFTCLLQWSKIKTECPLCKQTFKSIIHNVRSEGDYDQYDVHQTIAATLDVAVGFPNQQWEVIRSINISPIAPSRNFMYRTTMAPHHQRRFNPLLNADAVARREQIPSHAPQVSRDELRRRSGDPLEFRRQVYRQGTWAADLPDAFGRFRESSAEYYRRHPGETHRLVPWLNRELQVLLNANRSHIAYVISVIMDTITRFDIQTASFRNVIRPYFGIHTDQFVHEFSIFARSNFDLIGYDQSVVYHPHRGLGLSNEYAPRTVSPLSSSTSDSDTDSDVRLVEDDHTNGLGMNTLSVGPHMIDMPGPSTVGQALRLGLPRIIPIIPQMPPVVYTISSTSSDSENECEVIGYVKPRHERTPEIIDLESETEVIIPAPSTSEANNIPEVPLPVIEEVVPGPSIQIDLNVNGRRTRHFVDEASRCCMYEYFSSTSENDSDESDSDYNPQVKSRRRKKKSSKSSPRKLRSRKRKKSTGTKSKREKSRRDRSYSEAEDESKDVPSTSRGTKRNVSENSDSDKPTKKSKKSKKSKSSKKSKKTKTKTPKYIEYSSPSEYSSMSSESETETRVKKKEEPYEYSEEKEQEEPRYAESECSSRLRIDENSHTSAENDVDDDDDDEDDDEYPKRTLKSIVTAASAAPARDSNSSDSEHSATTKTSRGRYRSHKKHKDNKKRRRSRS